MNRLNIHALLMAIRGLSNQITVRGLADALNISYSTLARCKNGVWPRSITVGAMHDVLDGCRIRYFEGDGKAMAARMIALLQDDGVDTAILQRELAQGGFDAFVEEAIRLARSTDAEEVPESTSQNPEPADELASELKPELPEPAPPAPVNTLRVNNILLAMPLGIVLLVGLLNVQLAPLFSLAAHHPLKYLALSAAIAVLPAVLGIVVDSPIAWRTYIRDHPDARLTAAAFARVAKFGSPDGIVAGTGRFNLTLPHLTFQPVCNLLAALACASLFALLRSLPAFEEFFVSHEWVEYLKVGIAVSYFVAYESMRDQCRRPLTGDPRTSVCENPDNYLPSRAHVWANGVHLVWTISQLIVLLLGLLAYSLAAFRTVPAPASMLWPYIFGVGFFAFTVVSPYAVQIHATAVGTLVPGIAVLSLGFAALALVCYLPSAAGSVLVAACAACLVASIAWERASRRGNLGAWLADWHGTGAYPIVVVVTILALLALSFATVS